MTHISWLIVLHSLRVREWFLRFASTSHWKNTSRTCRWGLGATMALLTATFMKLQSMGWMYMTVVGQQQAKIATCNRIFFLQALRSTWTASLLEDGFETMQTPVVSCSCWLSQNAVQVILAAHGNLEYLKVSGVGLLCSASGDLLGYKAEKKKQATGCSQADPIEANAAWQAVGVP